MNTYENAEPKTLKTLNSNGQVLDDSGNVISDTTDYWKKLYNEAEPKSDKILHSDGTIKDSAGNVIQDSTSFNVKKYNQAEPIPAKYLHSDGTIDENPGSGGGADLEDNKQVSITENGIVEITPSAGKDGMKKVTANVNVSGGGGVSKLYYVTDINSDYAYMLNKDPATLQEGDSFILIKGESLDYIRKELTVTEVSKDGDNIYISYTPEFEHDKIERYPLYSEYDINLL